MKYLVLYYCRKVIFQSMKRLIILLMMTFVQGATDGSGCAMLNDCNGHGSCNTATKICTCYVGWGAPTDVAEYKSPDCSLCTLFRSIRL